MRESEFKKRYAKRQETIRVSTGLKELALAEALRDAEKRRKAGASAATSIAGAQTAPHPRMRRSQRWRRGGLAAAACLVAVALLVGVPTVVASTHAIEGEPGIPAHEASSLSGFAVRAYASDGTSLLALGNDGTVVFDRADQLNGVGNDYPNEGFFTGCLFRIEGEGIARVQMNVTGGQLYRYTVESFRQGDEPERMKELLTTKSTNRGMGTYYGAYDEASILPFRAGTDVKGNPDAIIRVGLSKLYGSTIDISAGDDPGIATGETSFGLWTNEGDLAELSAQRDSAAAIIDQFEGRRLTVTVTFEDGHASTQVIELHAADFRIDEGDPDDPNDRKLVPEIVDARMLGEDEAVLHSLYGTVVEANDKPFPLPLGNANERAEAVMSAATLDRQGETNSTGRALGKDDALGEGSTIEKACRTDGSTGTLAFGYPTVQRSATLPGGKALGDLNGIVHGWLGDAAYMSKCSQEVFGYGFNDDGTLTSSDFTYVTAAFDIENKGGDVAEVWPRAVGDFAIIDGNGQVAMANTGYELDFEASENALPAEDPQHIRIAPGDKVRLTVLRVLSNRLAEDPTLLFVPTNGTGTIDQAFAVGGQL